MTQLKETKFLLRNLHSFIKNDNIEQFTNLVSLYPNIIHYKNNKNENLLFYSLLKNSPQISSYLLALNSNLLLERNSNGANAIQASLARDGNIDFFIEFSSNLNLEQISQIFKNVDNQGNNLLMMASHFCNATQLESLIKICPSQDIFYIKNRTGSNFTHFLTSNARKYDFSNIFPFLDSDLFLIPNKTGTTPIMLAANFYSKDDFDNLTTFSFQNLNSKEIQDFCEKTNLTNCSIIEYSLFNPDFKIYLETEKDYVNSAFTFNTLQKVIERMKNYNDDEHLNNLIHYIKNHEPLNELDKKHFYKVLLISCLNNKYTSLLEKIIISEPDIFKNFNINDIYIINGDELKNVENLPGKFLFEIINNEKNNNTITNSFLYKLIYTSFKNNYYEVETLESLIKNFDSIYQLITDSNPRKFASFIIHRLFNFKTENLKEILTNETLIQFCEKYNIKNILGLVSYTRNLEYSHFLDKNEPYIDNYLNEHIISSEGNSIEDNQIHIFLQNKKTSTNPTYGYWKLFNPDIYSYFEKLKSSSLSIDGLSLSCNNKVSKIILENNEIPSLLLTLKNQNINNHFSNFFSDYSSMKEFIDEFKRTIKTASKEHFENLFSNALRIIAFTDLSVNNQYINNLINLISCLSIDEKLSISSSNLVRESFDCLKVKLNELSFFEKVPLNILKLHNEIIPFSLYNIIPNLNNTELNLKIFEQNLQQFTSNNVEKKLPYKNGVGSPFKKTFSEVSKPLTLSFKPVLLEIMNHYTNNYIFDTDGLYILLSQKQDTFEFLNNFNNSYYDLMNYCFLDKNKYSSNLNCTPFVSSNVLLSLIHKHKDDKNIISKIFIISKLNNFDLDMSEIDLNLDYKNINDLILLTNINPTMISDTEIYNYWAINLDKHLSENISNIDFDSKDLMKSHIFFFADKFPDLFLNNKIFKKQILNILNNESDNDFSSSLNLINYPRDFFEKFLLINYNNPKITEIIHNLNEDIFSNYQISVQIENQLMKDEIPEKSLTKAKTIKF